MAFFTSSEALPATYAPGRLRRWAHTVQHVTAARQARATCRATPAIHAQAGCATLSARCDRASK